MSHLKNVDQKHPSRASSKALRKELMRTEGEREKLSSLGAEDSGNSSCECSHAEGTTNVELDFTVVTTGNRTNDSFSELPNIHQNSFHVVLILVLILVLATGVVLFLQMIVSQRRRENVCPELRLHHLPSRRRQTPNSSPPQTVVEDIEPYDVFQQKENVLYLSSRAHSCSTISSVLT
ncbi:hypothetical protein FQA47_022131 [Oryzias melastigma]|uniref:Uncharacterized protein n=1 Tax=Oryzias melastigma TaxID=30732 RepID=A0A834L096_ORYME|nr:hypothetical protein FQA47_022131 [Oryzias melastigma]